MLIMSLQRIRLFPSFLLLLLLVHHHGEGDVHVGTASAFTITTTTTKTTIRRLSGKLSSSSLFSSSIPEGASLDGDEPLSVLFQRAVVLQRSGDPQAALKEYQLFLKAATQISEQNKEYLKPEMLAEVYNNVGAVYVKLQQTDLAIEHLTKAVQVRKLGTAYVNLALLTLQQGQQQQTSDPTKALQTAQTYCQEALALQDDSQSVATATKLLGDIERMLLQVQQAKNQQAKGEESD